MKVIFKKAIIAIGMIGIATACSTEQLTPNNEVSSQDLNKVITSQVSLSVVTDCKFVGYGGYCTDGVLDIKNGCIPWTGNAKDWLKNAKAAGYETGSTAKKGAIVVFPGATVNGNTGHVGVMIDGTTMWSMNDICGRWTYTKRAVSAYASSSNKIAPIGYIYYKLDTNKFPADSKSCTKK